MEKISNQVVTKDTPVKSTGGGRLQYIDVLRGITMILVVYIHTAYLVLGNSHDIETPLSTIMLALRMPLFFFISGFIGFKSTNFWNKKNYISRLFNKSKVQLVPTFVFFGIFYIFVQQVEFPAGYWFTLALFITFVIYFTVSFFLHKTTDIVILITMATIAIVLIAFRSHVLALFPYHKYYCINEIATYLGFFVAGLCFRRYQAECHKFLSQNGVVAGLFIAFTILYYIIYHFDGISISQTGIRYLLGLPLILIFYNYFYIHRDYWAEDRWISRKLQFVGRRTLDIYVLHYFFMQPSIPWCQKLFSDNNNEALLIVICGSLTVVVVLLCLFISSLLRSSSVLSYWLFGSKK